MAYQLNQTTQLGKMTDTMLEKLTQQSKERSKDKSINKEEKASKERRNKQIDYRKMRRLRADNHGNSTEKAQQAEYENLKVRDHKLALKILTEELIGLEEQIAEYKLMIQAHETGKSNLQPEEMAGTYKIYEHLMLQKQSLEERMLKYDHNGAAEQFERDEEKERIIRMLVKKYSDTLV